MTFLPRLRLTLRTPLPPWEATRRLGSLFSARRWEVPLHGRVDGPRFRGTHLLPGTRRIETVVSGEVTGAPAGSVVVVTLRANAFGLVLAAIAPLVLLVPFLAGQPPKALRETAVLAAVAAGLYVTVVALFLHDARKVRTLLCDALAAEARAEGHTGSR